MKLFDYLFFRVYSFYKKNKDSSPVWMGCLVLSLCVCFSIFSIVALLSVVFGLNFDNILMPIMLVFLILFPIIFWRRYSKEEPINSQLIERFENENLKSRFLKGFLFVLYLILVILIPLSVGYMRHNLGMNI